MIRLDPLRNDSKPCKAKSAYDFSTLLGMERMKRFYTFLSFMIALFAIVSSANAAHSTTSPLHIGDTFPEFSGRTLAGKSLALPATGTDKFAVLVFSFSRAAGKDARQWNEHLSRDFSNAISSYGVILLESAPKVFRRMAVSGIKSSMPLSVQNRTMVLYRNEELWKQRLAVTDNRRAYVLLLGPSGNVCWVNSGAFSDAEYTRLKNRLQKLPCP
jgi:hypothetical protein